MGKIIWSVEATVLGRGLSLDLDETKRRTIRLSVDIGCSDDDCENCFEALRDYLETFGTVAFELDPINARFLGELLISWADARTKEES